MRVSKVVREYIEKRVREKVEPKYEADRLLVEKEQRLIDEAIKEANAEAVSAFAEVMGIFSVENPFVKFADDFLDKVYMSYCHYKISSKNDNGENSPYEWRRRMNKEIEEKTANIIITLELGGNKDDLDRLLSEI